MSNIMIEGPRCIGGSIRVQGAKNSALPLLAAALIGEGESIIHNCPDLSDVEAAINILVQLGCKVKREGSTVVIDSTSFNCSEIPDELMREMRSSIVFLGAIIARCDVARLSFPGGCELGPRPIDLHISGLRQLGAKIEENHGYLECSRDERLKGCEIDLALPSVGATENIMLAASTAEGTTVIRNAAREPEISDLADFLNGCGAKIHGAGESSVVIEGVERLHGTEHTVIPDRIVAATYMAAAAATRGHITLNDVIPAHLYPVIPVFTEAGCEISVSGRELTLIAPRRLKAVKMVRTMAHPGFPTDAQPPVMAMLTVAEGNSMFVENIFENRYKHVGELTRLGAHIKVEGKVAVVEGVPGLYGANVEAGDLRGGAALLVAALAAEGRTAISGIKHIDRGYEKIVENFSRLGADLVRLEE